MTHLYNRLLTAIALMVMLTLGLVAVVSAASADTGPWQWSDISDKLNERTNRPVWASAFAHPYWYLTDGQELYSGGHVWKTDGSVMTDITTEVRNAGLSRVDDIVSDGQTIMFLKNVVSNTNNFEILTYKDGSWGYPANTWKSRLDSGEALASINGKNGIWIITTAKGRIFKWTKSSNSFELINIPNSKRYSYSNTVYSVRHTSPIDGYNNFTTPVAVPVWDGWLIAAPNTNGNYRYWKLPNSGSLYEITNRFTNVTYLQALASDGSRALIAGGTSANRTDVVHIYESNTSNNQISTYNLPFSQWNDAIIENNGKSWMILNNKNLVRLDNNYFTNYGETRDYFVTMSGNGNGTMLLGGAVSALGNSNPTSPLTAKLVRVDEGTGYVNTTPTVTTSGDVWASMTVSNNNHDLYQGDSSNVYVNSGSRNGINRVEIWLNGTIVKTCNSAYCDYTINSYSYTKGSAISFNARAVDNNGHEAWTWLGEYYIPVDDYYNDYNYNYDNNNNYYNSDGRLSVWFDFSPSGNQMYGNDYKSIQAHANAQDGLKKLEIYVNDNLKRTCSFSTVYGDQNCYYSIYSNQYSSYDKIKVYVKAYDNYGRQIQTNAQYVYRDGYWDDNYDSGNYDSSVAAWFDGNVSKTTLGRNESRNIIFYGNANRGLDRLELYANGSIIGTCNYSAAYGDQTCSKTIYGNNFNAGQSVTLKVKATDRDGYQNWSGTISFNIKDDGSGSSSNYVNAWMWFNPSGTDFADGTTKTIKANATANDGLSRVEIYANNNLVKTCNFSRSYGTQACEVSIYENNYNSVSSIPVYVKAIDYYGRTDTSETQYLYRDGSSSNTGENVYTWLWFEPSDTNLNDGESSTIKINASADNGLKKIEIYANGSIIKTCNFSRSYGTQACEVSIYANNYSANSTINVYARATDYNGRTDVTDTKYFYRYGSGSNTGSEIYAWMWLDPSDTNLDKNDSKTINVGAAADNGLQKIEIYADSALKRTCTYSRSYGNQECSTSIYGYNYTANKNISIFARAYDYSGRMTQTSSQNIYVTGNDYNNNQNNVDGYLTITSNRDSGYTNYDQITFTANGSDGNGINKIEILVNAQIVKTCNSASTCSYIGGPYNTETVSYGANLYDSLGNRTWTGYKTIYKK